MPHVKPEKLVVPVTEKPEIAFGSDAVAELLSRLDLPYIAMVPGASYRGLHDSLVNYLGNSGPQMVVCLHEEHAVAVAQGYAKVTGRPMLVALHANIGLLHATMAIYNAYGDRVPMVILGAAGPVDAAKRRPWIDWIHTSADQAALVRHYVKWDDQPASVQAAVDSVMRGHVLTQTEPCAPVYVCLDTELQEDPIEEPVRVPDPAQYPVPLPPAPDAATVARLTTAIVDAERPLLMIGRAGRGEEEWARRVALAEASGVAVLTDMRNPAVFPTTHPSHPARVSAGRLSPSGLDLLRSSDLVVALNWTDLAGPLRAAYGDGQRPQVVNVRNVNALLNGWTKDHYAPVASDLEVTAGPDEVVTALLAHFAEHPAPARELWPPAFVSPVRERPTVEGDQILMADLAATLREVTDDVQVSFTQLPLGWSGEDARFEHPLDFLGRDGGGGLASGPGIAVGAALALDGTDRLPVAIIGDGDYLMGSSALWSAAHYRLPLLLIVANNRSYHNDEKHQATVAARRGRPVENRTVGQHLRDPDPDLAGIARGHGLTAYGPVIDPEELPVVLAKAVAEVRAGGTVLVDVRVNPHGYGEG